MLASLFRPMPTLRSDGRAPRVRRWAVPEARGLPTFLVIGAMKAGTTSLYEYLRAHPQVFMATPKELHFFPADKQWALGVDWYAAHFDAAGEGAAAGGNSP